MNEELNASGRNDGTELEIKQSVDEDIRSMLSVTPVNLPSAQSRSDSNDESVGGEVEGDPPSNEGAFSSSSASSGSDHSSEDSLVSSEEDEDDQVQMLETPNGPTLSSTPQSEWDKALMTGTQSRGRASDFFVPTQPILSSDSSEFYSTVQAARATAPGRQGMKSPISASTKGSLPPPRPTSRNQSSANAESMSKTHVSKIEVSLEDQKGNASVDTIEINHSGTNTQSSLQRSGSIGTATSLSTASGGTGNRPQDFYPASAPSTDDNLNAGVLPDVLMNMRQRIESINMFDSDLLRLTNDYVVNDNDDPMFEESRESLKRSSQQSISAAVLVSLAHKRYERRRLAAMEIEKVVRSLVVLQHQSKQTKNELDRVRAILLLLSDDYVRSTNEDARKGGVVALAACAIGLKKANDHNPIVQECRDLILASVVHACQDHSQRVRYYATESLFNVVKGR
jgi:hypothetical protein